MNGICGMYAREDGRVAGLEEMLAALPGPAAYGRAAWGDGGVGLGWRGEAAPDRAERQPVVDRRAGLAVTASVRIDDRAALCESLEVPHPERPALPDGALILRAYRRWGTACPDHLLGDYAFAVWDAGSRTLLCARDHIGSRPFYYCLTDDRIVFASDINAVLAAPGVSDRLDEAAVATRLSDGSRSFGARTFFRDVRRLPPGHVLEVSGRRVRVERWWRPEDTPAAPSCDDDGLAERFLDLYSRAVEDRVRGPHAVGVHLSGGLDSSSIAALAARALRRAGRPAPLAFSWQPPPGDKADNGPETAELRLIETVRRQERLRLFYCPPGVDDLVAYLRRDAARDLNIHVNEEPVQTCAGERGVRVLLSGWGGDEGISFNGRGYYQELLRTGRVLRLWRELGEHSPHPLASIAASVALPLVSPSAGEFVRALRCGRRRERKRTFIDPAFARRVEPLPAPARLPAGVRRFQLHLLGLGHLADRMEGWAARGARRGIVYGYPLLDRRVLELALGLPPEQFRRGRSNRWLMRRALGRLLPPEVCWSQNKSDPVRYRLFHDALDRALPVIRRILQARSTPPLRSRYMDMTRLMKCLDAGNAGSRPGPVMNALRVLDF